MKNIEIKISNKIATLKEKFVGVCGNSDYVVVFDFDDEWKSHATKTARFKHGGQYTDVVFTGNECPMPIILDTASVEIGVYAGNLHTTTPACVLMKTCILSGSGVPADPTPDVYNQIIDKIDAGMLKGDKGDKGEKGDPGADGAPGKDGSDANVTAQNIEAALGYVPVTPSDLAAKQDVLTDADRQSITKTGMTTGAAWTSAEQKAARERIGIDKAYELIEEIVLEEEVKSISRSPFSYPCTSVLGCVTLPVIDSSFGFYMEAYLNTKISNVVGKSYGSSGGSEEIMFEETVKNGVLTGTSQGRVRGWGSGPLFGINNAASLFFCEAIIGVRFYTPDSGKSIPAGTKIKIYGVRA